MIEKKRPRKLNSSKDSRVRGADEMYDAMNINVSSDFSSTDAGGNDGVIKAADGNRFLSSLEGGNEMGDVRIIGSILDDENNVLYYFVHATEAQYQGIYAYDPDGFFPNRDNQDNVKAIYRTSLMNFPSDGFVKGDMVVLSKNHSILGKDYDVDPVLYFTDGVNEPRKIHVLNAYENLRSTTTASSQDGGIGLEGEDSLGFRQRYDLYDTKDFLHSCPKTPVHPIQASFSNDPDTRTSNFEGISGMQFAYQYIYKTGEESALSTYSDIIVPPAYVQQGAKGTADLSTTNICNLRIPTGVNITDDSEAQAASTTPSEVINRYLPRNVSKIRILMREGNRGLFSVVDTISVTSNITAKSSPILYEFRNDRVKKGFSKTEAQKPFDAVPLVAGAQTSASNRMMYSDYVDGYDNVDVTAVASVNYGSRLEDFKSLDINVVPTIDLLNQKVGNVNGRRAGFYFDVDGFPEDGLSKGSTVDLTITVRPKRNWHIYNNTNSFHGSRHLGNLSADNIDPHPTNDQTTIEPYQVSPNLASDGISEVGGVFGEPGISGDNGGSRSRTDSNSNLGLNTMWGANNGVTVGVGSPRWKTIDSQHQVDIVDGQVETSPLAGDDIPGVYGTSPANPFILRGRPLLFNLSLRVTQDLFGPSYKKLLRDFIQKALTWDQDNVSQADQFFNGVGDVFYNGEGKSAYLEILNLTSTFEYEIDEGLAGGDATTTSEEAVSGAHTINVSTAGDDRKHLIIAVGNGNVINNNSDPEDLRFLPPCGYIIVNKARPKFSLRSRNDISNNATYGVLHLNLDSISDVETQTCIPFVDAELWKDKAMELNPNNGGERGPENTVYWAEQGIGDFKKDKNWGLRDATVWQLETMVIDKWYCYSKEFMVRNTVPQSIFTSLYSDYARYLNGPAIVTQEQIDSGLWDGFSETDDEGNEVSVSVGALITETGAVNPDTSNGGVLKNAAVLKENHILFLLQQNALGVAAEDSNDDDNRGSMLHFRHNMRLRVGGDGFLPAINSVRFGNQNGNNVYPQTRARIIGWMDTSSGWIADLDGRVYNDPSAEQQNEQGDSNIQSSWDAGYSLLDGAGGIGSKPGGGEAKMKYDKGKTQTMGSVNGMMVFCGYIGPRATVLPTKIKDGSKPPADLDFSDSIYGPRYENYFKKFGQDCMMPFLGQFNYIKLSPAGGYMWKESAWPLFDVGAMYYSTPMDLQPSEGGQDVIDEQPNHDWTFDFRDALPNALPVPDLLDVGGGTILAEEIQSGGRSFKTRSNHSFGIVFYDERGRAGRVNPIEGGTVYIQGYDERDEKGAASVNLGLTSSPPDWATQYQIVYAGNSSKSNFIQYTTGGAFVAVANEEEADDANQNIYVSLNYLQGNKDVSYAEAFGAVSPNGAKQLYTYSPGDKLRVLSYFTSSPFDDDGINEDARQWVTDVEFDIVGVEELSRNPEINPLRRAFSDNADSVEMADAKSGQFLVLKNNPFANGFSYNDVKNGGNKPTTSSHNWNNICVVEIYSPTKETSDEDAKLYYEMGRVYDIGKNDDGPYFKTNPVLIERGDVWFRRVPLAVPEFVTDSESTSFNKFENLVTYDKDLEKGSTPKFQNYYLETKAFNDSFAGNDSINRGKPNIIDDEYGQSRHKSSITYSDKHVFNKSKNRFSSFNAVEGNFKDLPGEYGQIDYLVNNYDSIVVLQDNKASKVPVERSILSTADGSNSLVQSKEVLGVQAFYAGDYGSDGHPEAVLKAAGYIFFASKTNSEVYRLNPSGGIEVISDAGMKSAFYKAFNNLSSGSAHIPTGYDPLNVEFLITLKNISARASSGVSSLEVSNLGEAEADTGQDVLNLDEVEIEQGCTDGGAANYDAFAFEDDGSCIFLGCTDPNAVNYNPQANLDCTPGTNTLVEGVEVINPDFCECRYFNPCIIDAFSEIPDGKSNYKDLVEFNSFYNTNGLTIPSQGGYSPFSAQSLFTAGVLNGMGLDFTWVPVDRYPPIELNGGREWVFSEGDWTDHCFNYFAAAYTEGPQFVDEPTTVSFGGGQQTIGVFEYAVEEGILGIAQTADAPTIIANVYGLNQVSSYYIFLGLPENTSDSVALAPFWGITPASFNNTLWRQVAKGEGIAVYNAAETSCLYKACTDPDANNQDPTALPASSCLSSGDDAAFRADDEDPFEPPFIDCTDIPFNLVVCSTPGSSNVGETNLSPNSEPGATIANPVLFSEWDNLEITGPPFPSIKIIANYEVTTEAIISKINSMVFDCPPGSVGSQYGYSLSVSDSCFNDGDDPDKEEPEVQEAYVYFTGCCEYNCGGDYFLTDGAADNLDQWTEDFDVLNGRDDCINLRYPKSQFGGGANPNIDYNPNVSGIQPDPD